ncbi:MAG TPA: pantoate--beta-alanine ligase [Geobacteraceae bacterium]|nr:pantoate--beta-alanine ligase [Geobacteraceae bacterium]
MKLIESVDEMQQLSLQTRGEGKSIALVPTMGYLHAGHASLMHEGRKRCDLLVTSIFVNPTQFGAGEDLDKYPRDMERDRAIAAAEGVDVIFAPGAGEMYPSGFQTWVDVDRLSLPLCGASRPGHFRGVTTVVCKLFSIVQPTLALFGMKDYQQLAVIRRMTADLNLPVEIVGMPIVRETDGLAMSSRNAYLSPENRIKALCLSRAIQSALKAYRGGERNVAALDRIAREQIVNAKGALIDYLEFRNGASLELQQQADDLTLLALAVKIGTTRLIDNCMLGDDSQKVKR